MQRLIISLFSALLLVSCTTADLKLASLKPVQFTQKKIDFEQISWFAKRASAAYLSKSEIFRILPNTVWINTPKDTKVRYFLEVDPTRKIQTIAIRGTTDLKNIVEDLAFDKRENHQLGLHLHRGFDKIARKIFKDIRPHLKSNHPIRVTGHSLGAAVGVILMMYLKKEGYTLAPSINFGQPKVTDAPDAERFGYLPITRIVDGNDPVPMFPPYTLINAPHGAYAHIGPEVILLDQKRYVYLNKHDAERISVGEFWRDLATISLDDHSMEKYIKRINALATVAKQVTYARREAFIK